MWNIHRLADLGILVTGGSSGIGLATVELLIQEGAKVAFCGRDQQNLDRVLSDLMDRYPSAQLLAHCCDVLVQKQVIEFSQAVKERFGGLDALINNAGGGRVSTFSDTTDEQWLQELTLKFFGVIYPVRAFLPLLEESTQASIVCVNSLLAVQPEPHMVATSSARAGLLNLVRSMAAEFAPKGVRVNSILLGTVRSAQWQRRYDKLASPKPSYEAWLAQLAKEKNIPLGRFGDPQEPAKAMVLLASPAMSYTTGSSIDLSGGMARHI
jgi:NAD(P)-dependent dehydrogenase (short-subunit alcohol dehydrogenase family)